MNNIENKLSPAEKTHDLDEVTHDNPLKRVLIVEDEADFSELLRVFLEGLDYKVDVASDGVRGIKQVMANNYGVVLCDMVMPNLAGDMFYRAVERVKPDLCKRFIFMTGHQNNSKIEDFIRKVGGLVLWKPFELHVLLETIQVVEKKARKGK